MMTFQQFQLTRKKVERFDAMDGCDPFTALVYQGDIYIQVMEEDGDFMLIIENRCWRTDDLVELENRLFAFAISAGIVS